MLSHIPLEPDYLTRQRLSDAPELSHHLSIPFAGQPDSAVSTGGSSVSAVAWSEAVSGPPSGIQFLSVFYTSLENRYLL